MQAAFLPYWAVGYPHGRGAALARLVEHLSPLSEMREGGLTKEYPPQWVDEGRGSAPLAHGDTKCAERSGALPRLIQLRPEERSDEVRFVLLS